MDQAHNNLLRIFTKAEDGLQGIDPCDSARIVDVGASLEQALSDVPDHMPSVHALLMLCLDVLQRVYEKHLADPQSAVGAIAASVGAAKLFLLTDDVNNREAVIDEATRSLQTVLDPLPEPPASATRQRSVSLDDVAALLLQLEATDLTEMAEVRDLLQNIADAGSLPSAAREAITCSAATISDIVDGRASDPQAALIEVGRLVEIAMNASDPDAGGQTNELQPECDNQLALPADSDPEMLREFITECGEYIEAAEASLLALETDPDDAEAVNTVFRAFHTIKGTSAFLGLSMISDLAHKAETLLSRMRDGEIRCTGGYADLALYSVDALKDLVERLQSTLSGDSPETSLDLSELMRALTDPEAAGVSGESDETGYEPPRLGDILVAEGKAKREDVEAIADGGALPIGAALVKSKAAPVREVARALRTQKRLSGAEQTTDSSVRVRTDRLDLLIDTVGELVIAHSMVAQDPATICEVNPYVSKKVAHMGKIVRELQSLSMSMRMVPLRPTFQKMARLARDVAHKNGKTLEFVIEGDDTEIDRNMVDIINDPLVHMVRNAVDHGIETSDIRKSNGKPTKGTVRLSACHSGGFVVLEMQDDGRGLDRDKIIRKATSKGLIESDRMMSDTEIFSLIFEPGFSTADRVTDISGRGVGLDVVKRGVEALRGRIDISSEPGNGCMFTICLPLTLAVTDGMLVGVGDEKFIIPIAGIRMSFRPDADCVSTVAGRGELVTLRGETMQLIRLHRLFGITEAVERPADGLVVVFADGNRHCAILVDDLLGQQYVVAKPLGDGIGRVQGISGAAILGDGKVGLILDLPEIAAMTRQIEPTRIAA